MAVPTKEGFISAMACIFIIMVGSTVDGNIVKLLVGVIGGISVSYVINFLHTHSSGLKGG